MVTRPDWPIAACGAPVANSRRFATPLAAFPTIRRIEEACLLLDTLAKAAPAQQPDASDG